MTDGGYVQNRRRTDWNISQSPHATGHSNIPFRSYPSASKYHPASFRADSNFAPEIVEGGNELDEGAGVGFVGRMLLLSLGDDVDVDGEGVLVLPPGGRDEA